MAKLLGYIAMPRAIFFFYKHFLVYSITHVKTVNVMFKDAAAAVSIKSSILIRNAAKKLIF